MGIHICVVDDNWRDVDGWDYIRYANDSTFRGFIDWNYVEFPNLSDYVPDGVFRPTNVKRLRELVSRTDWENKDRYYQLLDILDEGYWLNISM